MKSDPLRKMRRLTNVVSKVLVLASIVAIVGWQGASNKAPIVFFRGKGKVTIKSNGKVRLVLNGPEDLRKPAWVMTGDEISATGTAFVIYESNGEWRRGPAVNTTSVGARPMAASLKGARSQSGDKDHPAFEWLTGDPAKDRLYVPEDTAIRFFWASSGKQQLVKVEVAEAGFTDKNAQAVSIKGYPLSFYQSKTLADNLRGLRKASEEVPIRLRLTFADGVSFERAFRLVSKNGSGSLNAAFNRWQDASEEMKDLALNDYLVALESLGCGPAATDLVIAEWQKDIKNWAAREWMAGLGARSKSRIVESFFSVEM